VYKRAFSQRLPHQIKFILNARWLLPAALVLASQVSLAAPTGAKVVLGQAQVTQPSATSTLIHQNTNKVVIEFDAFSIKANESVRFIQPSAASIALNRVVGVDPSVILGRLSANGQVFLVNPNGVFFGKSAIVDVAGLVATTLNISNDNFAQDRFTFSNVSNALTGQVVNEGHIQTIEGGYVVLAGDYTENSGLIQAALGNVVLASGQGVSLDLQGDGLIQFVVDAASVSRLAGVNNTGEIEALGGMIVMTGKVADGLVTTVVRNSGHLSAHSIVEKQGEIFLSAQGGDLLNLGQLDVSAQADGVQGGNITLQSDQTTLLQGDAVLNADSALGVGGRVHILGQRVGLFEQTRVLASGQLGGGEVLVGGDFQGQNATIQNAKRVAVTQDVSIIANARTQGDGGKVIIWADEKTHFAGQIEVKGGSTQGNGGFVEVSGKQTLFFQGGVDASAAQGENGQLLLDPLDIVIKNANGGVQDSEVLDNQILFGDTPGGLFTISENVLEGLTASVILQADQDIRIDNLSDNELLFNLSGGQSVTLLAGRDIIFTDVNDKIRTLGADIILEADSPASTAGADAVGNLNIGRLNAGTGFIDLNGVDITLDGDLTAGNIKVTGSTVTVNGTLSSDNVLGIEINGQNILLNGAVSTLNNGDFLLNNGGLLSINGGINVGGDFVQVGADVDLNNNIVTDGGDVVFLGKIQLFNDVTISTGSSSGDIQITDVDGPFGLTLDSGGSGDVFFVGNAGSTTALASFNVIRSNNIVLNDVQSSGDIELKSEGLVTLQGDVRSVAGRLLVDTAGDVIQTAGQLSGLSDGVSIFGKNVTLVNVEGGTSIPGVRAIEVNAIQTIQAAGLNAVANGGLGIQLNAIDITVTGDIFSTGDLFLTALNTIQVSNAASIITDSVLEINADVDANNVGNVNLEAGVNLTGATLFLSGADVLLQGNVEASSGELLVNSSGNVNQFSGQVRALNGSVFISGNNVTLVNVEASPGITGVRAIDVSAINTIQAGGLNAIANGGLGIDLNAVDVTVTGDIFSTGDLFLTALNNIQVSNAANIITDSVLEINADADANNLGKVSLDAGVNLTGATLFLSGADVLLQGNVEASSGDVFVDSSGNVNQSSGQVRALNGGVSIFGRTVELVNVEAGANTLPTGDAIKITATDFVQVGNLSATAVPGLRIDIDPFDVVVNGDILSSGDIRIVAANDINFTNGAQVLANANLNVLADQDANGIGAITALNGTVLQGTGGALVGVVVDVSNTNVSITQTGTLNAPVNDGAAGDAGAADLPPVDLAATDNVNVAPLEPELVDVVPSQSELIVNKGLERRAEPEDLLADGRRDKPGVKREKQEQPGKQEPQPERVDDEGVADEPAPPAEDKEEPALEEQPLIDLADSNTPSLACTP